VWRSSIQIDDRLWVPEILKLKLEALTNAWR